MDTLEQYRNIIQQSLIELTRIPFAHGDIDMETVFDRQSDRYLLVILGRENKRRIHSCLVHVDIINGKVWIQRDGTEDGIANQLVQAGIPREHIVLGFRSPELRKHTDFAVA